VILMIIEAVLSALLACSLIRRHWSTALPSRLPGLRSMAMALLRALLMFILFELILGRAFPAAERRMMLLCALLPALSLPDELHSGGADEQLCNEITAASRWSFLLWLIAASWAIITQLL